MFPRWWAKLLPCTGIPYPGTHSLVVDGCPHYTLTAPETALTRPFHLFRLLIGSCLTDLAASCFSSLTCITDLVYDLLLTLYSSSTLPFSIPGQCTTDFPGNSSHLRLFEPCISRSRFLNKTNLDLLASPGLRALASFSKSHSVLIRTNLLHKVPSIHLHLGRRNGRCTVSFPLRRSRTPKRKNIH